MDDPPLSILSNHKYFRLIYNRVLNHPNRCNLAALHGTVIVRGGAVVSLGLNDPGRNCFSDYYATHSAFTIHSELAAIKKVRRKIDLSGCVAYNLRLDKHGEVRMAKPCLGCQKLLADYGIKKCYYSVDGRSIDCFWPRRSAEMLEAAA